MFWVGVIPAISRIDALYYAHNKNKKGVMNVSENKNAKKENEVKAKEKKPLTKPGEVQGKIEVSDTRERKDGPGGN